jgi:hypothetical protein
VERERGKTIPVILYSAERSDNEILKIKREVEGKESKTIPVILNNAERDDSEILNIFRYGR